MAQRTDKQKLETLRSAARIADELEGKLLRAGENTLAVRAGKLADAVSDKYAKKSQ